MESKAESNVVFHFRVRRLIAKWANMLDPDLIVKRRDIADFDEYQREDWKSARKMIGDVAYALRRAFETEDEYERDWFLTWARSAYANFVGRPGLVDVINRAQGKPHIPTSAMRSMMDLSIYHVQKHIAHSMAMCKGRCENPCYFRRKAKQQYCGKKCRLASIAGSKRRSYQRKKKGE